MTPQSSCCEKCLDTGKLGTFEQYQRCSNPSCPCHKADTAEKCQPVEATHTEVQDALKHSGPWTCIVGNSVESCGGILEPDETGWGERFDSDFTVGGSGLTLDTDSAFGIKSFIRAEKEKSLAEGIERGRREEKETQGALRRFLTQ